MATAPVVIPFALTQLATNVALDATLTTAQTVFTSPLSEKVFPQFIVFRDVSASMNAATTVTVAAGSTTYLSASAVLQSMLTTTGPIWQPLYGSSVATAKGYIPGNTTFTVTFAGTLTSNGVVKADVFGYMSAF